MLRRYETQTSLFAQCQRVVEAVLKSQRQGHTSALASTRVPTASDARFLPPSRPSSSSGGGNNPWLPPSLKRVASNISLSLKPPLASRSEYDFFMASQAMVEKYPERRKPDATKSSVPDTADTAERFLNYYNEHVAPQIKTEQSMAQALSSMAYLNLQEGDTIACCVEKRICDGSCQDEKNITTPSTLPMEADTTYAKTYKVEKVYKDKNPHGSAPHGSVHGSDGSDWGFTAYYLKPADKEASSQRSIVVFRGTYCPPSGVDQEHKDSTGVSANLDRDGIGKTAFNAAWKAELQRWVTSETASVSVWGHSLGGVYAGRFVAALCDTFTAKDPNACLQNVRLCTDNAPALDAETADKIKLKRENLQLLQNQSDSVTWAGEKHPSGGQVISTPGSTVALPFTNHTHRWLLAAELSNEGLGGLQGTLHHSEHISNSAWFEGLRLGLGYIKQALFPHPTPTPIWPASEARSSLFSASHPLTGSSSVFLSFLGNVRFPRI